MPFSSLETCTLAVKVGLSQNTTGDNKMSAIKLGIAINPFKASDIFQTIFQTHLRTLINTNHPDNTIGNYYLLAPSRNSAQRSPCNCTQALL